MQANDHRRCETCRFYFRDVQMVPEEDHHNIPGYCGNEHLPSDGQLRMKHQGTQCKGWAKKEDDDEGANSKFRVIRPGKGGSAKADE